MLYYLLLQACTAHCALAMLLCAYIVAIRLQYCKGVDVLI